jgi:hypothetical protein
VKLTILLLAFLYTTFLLHSQVKKGDNVISLNGMYTKNTTQDGVIGNSMTVNNHHFNLGATFTSYVTNHFLLGFGLNYISQKDLRTSKLVLNDGHDMNSQIIRYEVLNLKSTAPLPFLLVGYNMNVTNKLNFNANLKINYGQMSTNTTDQTIYQQFPIFNAQPVLVSNILLPNITTVSKDQNDFAAASIIPEMTYFFTNQIGLSVALGGIQYSITDWKTSKSDFWINLSPNTWLVGLKYKL